MFFVLSVFFFYQEHAQQPPHHAHPEEPGRAGLRPLPGPAGALLPGGDTGQEEPRQHQAQRAGLLPVRRAGQAETAGAGALRLSEL